MPWLMSVSLPSVRRREDLDVELAVGALLDLGGRPHRLGVIRLARFVHVRPLQLLLRERGPAGDRPRRPQRPRGASFEIKRMTASLDGMMRMKRVDRVQCRVHVLRDDHLDLGALVLVGRRGERRHGVLQRILARQQRPHVDPARRQVVDRPVELDAPAERAAQVELLRHQLVDDERQRLVRQRADLHDDAAALGRRDAGLERVEVAGDLVGDVELRLLERVAVAVGAQRHVGADELRLRERTVEHVGDGDLARAGEPRRHAP